MTTADIRASLVPIAPLRRGPGQPQPQAEKVVLFDPLEFGLDWAQVDAAHLHAALDEIERKAPLVRAGVEEFSAAEKVVFTLMLNHAAKAGR